MPNVLDCSNKEMTSLSDILVPNETTWLVVKNNKIDHLQWSDESIENLHEMKYINFSNSSISSIGPNFFSKLATLANVHYLNLGGNKLKSFNKDIRQSGISDEIYLSGNPIDCNCDMFWFAKWLNTTNGPFGPRIVKDHQDIRCAGGEWDGTQVYRLTQGQMGCLPIVL